jgi:rhodanese-related sulfurtransferase
MTPTINREELKTKIDDQEDFVLVDALTEDMFHESHLPGAINIPYDHVKQFAKKSLPDKDAEIVVYCASPACDAAEKTALALEQMGYRDVRHYQGGKKDWHDAGLPLEVAEPHAAR